MRRVSSGHRCQRRRKNVPARLYAIEEKIRGEPAATRQAVRWTESAPLVNGFGVWLDEQRSRVSPRSRLGEKLTYIANQWDGLLAFLYDGRVEIDTNFVENRIRPVKLTAKNALFAGHDEGAAAWGRVASLIETCKMNGVEPYAWLKEHAGEDRHGASAIADPRAAALELRARDRRRLTTALKQP